MSTDSLAPLDTFNRALLDQVHPGDWINPKPAKRYNLVVIGAGTAGLVAAAGAAGLGARVALIEKSLMGGDCLVTGCVPSKALLRSARAVAEVRKAARLGVDVPTEPEADFGAVMERMRRIRSAIGQHDSARRFRDLGVDVFLGEAQFTGPRTIAVGGQTLRFAKAVIATGARAAVPPIPGLTDAIYYTNETIFNLTERPERLVIAGAGPIGCELAQAFQRLGSQVTLVETAPQILIREDADAARIVHDRLLEEGVELRLGSEIRGVRTEGNTNHLELHTHHGTAYVEADAILVAVGRAPDVGNLGLELAGVRFDHRRGIHVDDFLRTTNHRIFAAGDCCMTHKFTHAADAAARIVIQNALFGFAGKARASGLNIPWCTYTDPEIAHVGLSEQTARERGIAITTFATPMASVDRALLEDETDGLLKVHCFAGSDRIAGATLVGSHAGESIGEIVLAMNARQGLGTLAGVIHPYPTAAHIIGKTADSYRRTRLTPFTARLLRWACAWQR